MVSREYMERLGLSEDQITLLMEVQNKETTYRRLLESEHCTHIEAIVRLTDIESLDLSDEALVREKIRIDHGDLIPRQYRKEAGSNVQIWAQQKQYQK